jgi:hypothetical protein
MHVVIERSAEITPVGQADIVHATVIDMCTDTGTGGDTPVGAITDTGGIVTGTEAGGGDVSSFARPLGLPSQTRRRPLPSSYTGQRTTT